VAETVARFQETGIPVSLFIDPVEAQIDAAARSGAKVIELHTGPYSDAETEADEGRALEALRQGAHRAASLGLRVHAGHGLRTDNVAAVTALPEVEECSIGHWIVGRALSVGMETAVMEMQEAMRG